MENNWGYFFSSLPQAFTTNQNVGKCRTGELSKNTHAGNL